MKSPTPASFLVELFKKTSNGHGQIKIFPIQKHKLFQDNLMFHQEKLFYNLPAVKGDIKSVMRISAQELQTG